MMMVMSEGKSYVKYRPTCTSDRKSATSNSRKPDDRNRQTIGGRRLNWSLVRRDVSGAKFDPFLPRDALVHSAVLRLHVVRPSVCPSVTFVDQDHIGWKSWKLIERAISQHLRSS